MPPRELDIAPYAADPARVRRVQRRTLGIVVASQVLGGAGLAAGVTVGALLAEQMLGMGSLAGIPSALFTLGSALAAFLVGRSTQRWGRRAGLGAGFIAGGIGAIGVVIAAAVGSVVLLFAALFVYGAGTATNLQARYAGTDLAPATRRGTAVSVAMVSTTLGAVVGPNLVQPMGSVATAFGIPALAGPFLLAAAAYLLAGLVLATLLRPDPFLLARALADAQPSSAAASTAGSPRRLRPGVAVGATVMVLTQIAMVAIMTMTPVHMRAFHHGLTAIGVVIGIHIGAMYLPSLVTGALVDRLGRIPMAVASGVTLLLAGVIAAVAPGGSLPLLITALALLGVGWNFGLIAGTALIVDATTLQDRARTQGAADVLVALGGAGGGAMSGVAMAGMGYSGLSLAGGVLAVLLIPAVVWYRRRTAA
ncbi:MAG: MFS transporter [Microbacteriaceae bacterium]|nr:MFS transporter [Microbacteriaceae bacterium]MCL2794467.1 MFS transporter [Microbacteriaceae bacterium]